ncbi:hypothetical protein [Burkholderia cepacia]|uniref:hypothetical protein n=1 Tax=Burkholderia cepacia TaxID=292 RepID=UPI0018C4E243|nr:hypothetical protein [Burkholderia cepacia]
MAIHIVRPLVDALLDNGQLQPVRVVNPSGSTRVYYMRRAAGDTDANCALPPLVDGVAKLCSSDVFRTMKPGIGYRASTLAEHLKLSVRRVTELLAALQRDGRVVRTKLPLERHPHPVYFVAGSQPGDASQLIGLASTWSAQSTFDIEYGRSLRALRSIAEASR